MAPTLEETCFDAYPSHLLLFSQAESTVTQEGRMAQRIIDLDDLPAPIARGLEVVAEMARMLAGKPSQRALSRQSTTLATRKGIVYGSLRREEIYDEYLTHKTSHHA
jgi:hypothetical protein